MRAVVYRGPGKFALDPESPMPAAGPGEIVVKVRYSGVCGSDLHVFQNTGHAKPGVILGHENSGLVTEIGRGVTKVRVGDRVTALCGGGYAEYLKATEAQVIALVPNVTYEQAALAEPFAVGLRAVRDSGLRPGDRAAVIGTGPIGLFALQAAQLAGALDVYACEVAPARIEAAKRVGANAVFNPKAQDAVAELHRLAPDGVDVVYECAGAPGTLELSLQLLKKGGTVVVVGLSGLPDQFNPRWLFAKHAKVICIPAATEEWPLAVQLIAKGKVDPAKVVSHIATLDELPAMMDRLQAPRDHVQVLADPWGKRF